MVERVERVGRLDDDAERLARPRVLHRDVDLARACAPEERHVEAVAVPVIQLVKLGMIDVPFIALPPRDRPAA